MRRFLALFFVVAALNSVAQLGDCGNINFEDGNLNGWDGKRGYVPYDTTTSSQNPFAGPNGSCCTGMVPVPVNTIVSDTSARHTVMSTAGGNDPYGGFPVVPPPVPGAGAPAGQYSVRLGNDRCVDQGNGWKKQILETTYTPTATNNIFTIQYAVVLNTAPGDNSHIDKHGPWFEMLVLNQAGDTLPCTYQFQTANPSGGGGGIPPGWMQSTVPATYGSVVYKPWSTTSLDFIAYVGQPLTIRFTTADCWRGGHFAYAYFNCECWQIKVTGKDTICQGETSTLIAPYEDSASYSWTGPGGPYSGQTINVGQSGKYEVSITSPQGCVKKASYDVYVNQKPTAVFSQSTVCVGFPTVFKDASTVSDPLRNPIVKWEWDFGDGKKSTQKDPSNTYSSPGDYNATLVVTTKWGCVDTIIMPVKVEEPPVASFTGIDVCQGKETCFTNASTVPVGSITAYSVNYGDGTIKNNISPFCYTYNTSGTFKVILTVTSNLGCKDTASVNVLVHPYPDPDFVVTPTVNSVLTPDFKITDLTTGADSGSWHLGDGTDSSYIKGGQIIDHSYQGIENIPGGYEFDITLDVVNNFGCPNAITKKVFLEPYWTFYIPDAFTPNADGTNDMFFGKGEGILEYEMWIFDRWGNMIFHCEISDLPQDNPLCHWNGAVQENQIFPGYSGKMAQQDVYVWVVRLTDIFSEKHKYIGHVTLVK